MNKLKKLLQQHDVSQVELAVLLGRDRSVITNLLQGKRQLKAEEAVLIAQRLNISLSDLLGADESPTVFAAAEPSMIPFEHEPVGAAKENSQIVKSGGKYYLNIATQQDFTDKLYALQVADDSLALHGVIIGDIIVAELDAEVKDNDLVVIQHYSGGGAKTLLRHFKTPFLLTHTSSPDHQIFHQNDENIRIVSPMRQLLRLF